MSVRSKFSVAICVAVAVLLTQVRLVAARTTLSKPSILNRFGQAIGIPLRDSDYDLFIDKSVQGRDRILAKALMHMMPAGRRGDFLYFDGSRVISNNKALIPYARLGMPAQASQLRAGRFGTPVGALAAKSRPLVAGACSPGLYPGTGPYVRTVSNCGYNAAWGIVNIPCGVTQLVTGDVGYTYMEFRDAASRLSEAGLFTGGFAPDGSLFDPYISDGQGPALNNAAARYSCGNYLGVFAGVVNAQGGGLPYFYVNVGNITNYNSQNAWLPTETVYTNNNAWLFVPAWGDVNHPGVDSAGVPTPCTVCSVSKVTSIAQHGDNWDGSKFGIDPITGNNAIHWSEILFGEWLSDCTSALCNFQYSTLSQYWYAGQENYPNVGSANAAFSPLGEVYESYDGVIALNNPLQSIRRASGTFVDPTPPTCARDASGYCVAVRTSKASTVQCANGSFYSGPNYYEILDGRAVLHVFNHPYVVGHYADPLRCYQSYGGWTPADPKIYFNDPNLP